MTARLRRRAVSAALAGQREGERGRGLARLCARCLPVGCSRAAKFFVACGAQPWKLRVLSQSASFQYTARNWGQIQH